MTKRKLAIIVGALLALPLLGAPTIRNGAQGAPAPQGQRPNTYAGAPQAAPNQIGRPTINAPSSPQVQANPFIRNAPDSPTGVGRSGFISPSPLTKQPGRDGFISPSPL